MWQYASQRRLLLFLHDVKSVSPAVRLVWNANQIFWPNEFTHHRSNEAFQKNQHKHIATQRGRKH